MVRSVYRATGLLEYLWMRPNTFLWKVCQYNYFPEGLSKL